jgi:hypothetical protein
LTNAAVLGKTSGAVAGGMGDEYVDNGAPFEKGRVFHVTVASFQPSPTPQMPMITPLVGPV